MGLDQYFYKRNKLGDSIEVGYFRKNWALHEFICENIDKVDNGEDLVLHRDDIDKIIKFLRKNPTSDIFTYPDEDTGDLVISNTLQKTLSALALYDVLIYAPNW